MCLYLNEQAIWIFVFHVLPVFRLFLSDNNFYSLDSSKYYYYADIDAREPMLV